MTISAPHKDGFIHITLYGELTEERIAIETAISLHRATQLDRPTPKVERPKRPAWNPALDDAA